MIKCTNANRGAFNHECGRPATWAGEQRAPEKPDGIHTQHFCDRCKAEGDEAKTVRAWRRLPQVVIRIRARSGAEAEAVFAPEEWDNMRVPAARILAIHQQRRDILRGEPFDILGEIRF